MPQPVAALGSAAYGVGAGVQADAAVYAAQLYAAGTLMSEALSY